MPKLAVFPKAYMDALCVDGSMNVRQWIELAAGLEIDGLEFYTGFLELADPRAWDESRIIAVDHGLSIPMLCCSPDFTHPDAAFRQHQIKLQKSWIEMCAALGGAYCRVLSGQRRPELTREEGLKFAAD
jgi:sugar phosphate isomerase/epimerase